MRVDDEVVGALGLLRKAPEREDKGQVGNDTILRWRVAVHGHATAPRLCSPISRLGTNGE